MIWRYTAAVLIATWLFWQIPVAKTDTVNLPELFAATRLVGETPSEKTPTVFFYRKRDIGQYTAYGLDAAGSIVRTLLLPGDAATKADQSQVRFTGKEGYLTGPENGAYFIWYPQLGAQVYVFNEHGHLLWEKEESRYLQVLRRGRYIIAAAGDHSRILFLNPDFQVQADFQGMLFTQVSADDSPDLRFAQACLGSLDGEIVVVHLDRKLYTRQKLGYALKALACNFATGDMAAIVERTVSQEGQTKQVDFLLRLKFDLTAGKDHRSESLQSSTEVPEIVHEVELPLRTVTASAIAVTPQLICFVQAAPAESGEMTAALYFTRHRSDKLRWIKIAPISGAEAAHYDRWRATTMANGEDSLCLHSHPSGRLLVGSARGLLSDRSDWGGERMLAVDNAVFIQRGEMVYALR